MYPSWFVTFNKKLKVKVFFKTNNLRKLIISSLSIITPSMSWGNHYMALRFSFLGYVLCIHFVNGGLGDSCVLMQRCCHLFCGAQASKHLPLTHLLVESGLVGSQAGPGLRHQPSSGHQAGYSAVRPIDRVANATGPFSGSHCPRQLSIGAMGNPWVSDRSTVRAVSHC